MYCYDKFYFSVLILVRRKKFQMYRENQSLRTTGIRYYTNVRYHRNNVQSC